MPSLELDDLDIAQTYAYMAYASYMRGDAKRVRQALVAEYRTHYEEHYTPGGVRGFSRFIRDRYERLQSKEPESGVYLEDDERLLRDAAAKLPVCDECLGMMDYLGWAGTGSRTWDEDRPLLEAETVDIYPVTPPNTAPEKDRAIVVEEACPVDGHDDTHTETILMTREELGRALRDVTSDLETVSAMLELDGE